MKRFLTLFTFLSCVGVLSAEPLVVAFERFHLPTPGADAGRLLFNELGCASCHGGGTGLPARMGPELAAITQRVSVDWVRAFLASPSRMKEGTNMPHLFAKDDAADIEAVVHYLALLKPKSASKPKSSKYLNAERGSDVYHTMGCVTCHAPGKDYQPPAGTPAVKDFTHRSVPLPDMQKKYSLATLTSFLMDPLTVRPDGRMPHTEMHESDYADLAAYLLDFQHSDGTTAANLPVFNPDKALAAKGKTLVSARNCASCHDLPDIPKASPLTIRHATAGCMSASPAPHLPRYSLSQAQRTALTTFLTSPEQEPAPKTLAALSLQALNCTACHERGGLGGADAARKAYFTGDHNLGDTGLIPPPLTDAGRKFKPDWFKGVLEGKNRVRPYLQTKMPRFGKATDTLPALLAAADAKDEKPLPDGDAEAGRKLLGVLGGNSCITCHKWGERPSLGIQALDISNIHRRLQPGWLRDYLIDPASHRPGTLMPSFWPNGVAANQAILGGDTDRQIAALLAFAKLGKGEPEGFPATTKGEFELIPTDRPIVQRTFLKDTGTHAILVGFPAGIHLAYDGLGARPSLLWKGKFFDAYNTWFTRAAPFEKPLGEVIATWPSPAGVEKVRFGGYRLDEKGVPSFLWSVGNTQVIETFEPVDGRLHRTLTWQPSSASMPPITHPQGVEVTEASDSAEGSRIFIYSWK